MPKCDCQKYDDQFDRTKADKELAEYHKSGPSKYTSDLLALLNNLDLRNKALLDIGGGVGVIQHELFKKGISHVTSIDASRPYTEVNKAESTKLGHTDKLDQIVDDFTAVENVPPADLVTLDKVICCYHDMADLVDRSSRAAKQWYGIVIPQDTWLMRFISSVMNIFIDRGKKPFRFYVHSVKDLEAILTKNGFRRIEKNPRFVWQTLLYEKT